ncbi:unnamed protein product [Prorocentrum cordatum]|uniref:Protein kinase domain-containing protein n=1 Tax=Prorocentrum cordatum TaxID=2364126 RepID=A0ABN9UK34_9DINO|nr:unnamed protein product [Polarella glacialis]
MKCRSWVNLDPIQALRMMAAMTDSLADCGAEASAFKSCLVQVHMSPGRCRPARSLGIAAWLALGHLKCWPASGQFCCMQLEHDRADSREGWHGPLHQWPPGHAGPPVVRPRPAVAGPAVRGVPRHGRHRAREHGPAAGSALQPNFETFRQANISVSVLVGAVPQCRRCLGRREPRPGEPGGEHELVVSGIVNRAEFQLSADLTSLPCALQARHSYSDGEQRTLGVLFNAIKEARRCVDCILLVLIHYYCGALQIAVVVALQAALCLPEALQGVQVMLFLFVLLPVVSASLLFNEASPQLMKELPLKKADEKTLAQPGRLMSLYACRSVPTALVLVAAFLHDLHRVTRWQVDQARDLPSWSASLQGACDGFDWTWWVTGRWPRCAGALEGGAAAADSSGPWQSLGPHSGGRLLDSSCALAHAQQWAALLFVVYEVALAFTFLDRYDSLLKRGPASNKVLCAVAAMTLLANWAAGSAIVSRSCGRDWHTVLMPSWDFWLAYVLAWPILAIAVSEGTKRRDRRHHSHLQRTLRVLFNTRLGMWPRAEAGLPRGPPEAFEGAAEARTCGSEQRMFHAAHSATYQHGPMSVVLEYGSGEVLGKEAYETVSVGPLGSTEAPFWEVVDANMPLLQQSGFGAIVGLGPIPADATVLRPHGAENNKSFALLMRKLGADRYSVCLGRTPLSPGVLVWNDGLVESMPRAFTKVTTVEGGFWLTSLTDVRFGSTPVACFEPGSCGAILDSGTSLISTPEDAFVSIGELVEQLSVDCDNIAELPELHFKLDGIPHSLPPDSYIGRVRGNSTDGVKSHFRTSGSAAPSCQTTLMKINMDSAAGAVWVLGMPFFRRYYSAFVQATTESRASVYTALAGPDCQPVQGISQALKRGEVYFNSGASPERSPPELGLGATARSAVGPKDQIEEYVYFLLEAALGGELFTTYERLRLYGSVTDMGLAKVATGKTYTLVGTPDYMAPEVIGQTGHTKMVDWWMLGVLLYELLSGHAPFEADSTPQVYELVKRGIDQAHFPAACRGTAQELVRALCRPQPEGRLRAPKLCEHAWFSGGRDGFDWTALRNQALPAPHVPQVRGARDLANFRTCEGEDPPSTAYRDQGSGWDADFEDDTIASRSPATRALLGLDQAAHAPGQSMMGRQQERGGQFLVLSPRQAELRQAPRQPAALAGPSVTKLSNSPPKGARLQQMAANGCAATSGRGTPRTSPPSSPTRMLGGA